MLILLRKNDAQLISITNWKIVGEKTTPGYEVNRKIGTSQQRYKNDSSNLGK